MLNHYAYASANPIKYTDPTGLEDDWEGWGNGGSGWEDGGRDYGPPSTNVDNTSLNPGLEDFCDRWNAFVDKYCAGGGGFDGVSPPSAAEREAYILGELGKPQSRFDLRMLLTELGYSGKALGSLMSHFEQIYIRETISRMENLLNNRDLLNDWIRDYGYKDIYEAFNCHSFTIYSVTGITMYQAGKEILDKMTSQMHQITNFNQVTRGCVAVFSDAKGTVHSAIVSGIIGNRAFSVENKNGSRDFYSSSYNIDNKGYATPTLDAIMNNDPIDLFSDFQVSFFSPTGNIKF